jgi:hypothetical protein
MPNYCHACNISCLLLKTQETIFDGSWKLSTSSRTIMCAMQRSLLDLTMTSPMVAATISWWKLMPSMECLWCFTENSRDYLWRFMIIVNLTKDNYLSCTENPAGPNHDIPNGCRNNQLMSQINAVHAMSHVFDWKLKRLSLTDYENCQPYQGQLCVLCREACLT